MPDNSKSKRSKRLSLAIRSIVAVIALIWVFQDQEWNKLYQAFKELSIGYFALSLAAYISAQIMIGLRWWLLMRAQEIHPGLLATIRLQFLGLFYNNFMPGSVGGDLLRAWYVTKHTDKRMVAALSVFFDRAIGLLGMLGIAIVSYIFFMPAKDQIKMGAVKPAHKGVLMEYIVWIVGFCLVLAVVFCVMLIQRKSRAVLLKAFSKAYKILVHVFTRFKEAIVVYCKSPLTVFAALFLTVILQGIVVTSFWLLGLDLNVGVRASYYFIYFPITWILAALPISIAGAGVLEGGIKGLFTHFAGASADKVVALALCQRFVWILASLPGSIIHMSGKHLPKDFFVDDLKHID